MFLFSLLNIFTIFLFYRLFSDVEISSPLSIHNLGKCFFLLEETVVNISSDPFLYLKGARSIHSGIF